MFQLAKDGGLDWENLRTSLRPETKCALIQRSCGYSWRKSLSVYEIEKAIKIIKVSFSEYPSLISWDCVSGHTVSLKWKIQLQ